MRTLPLLSKTKAASRQVAGTGTDEAEEGKRARQRWIAMTLIPAVWVLCAAALVLTPTYVIGRPGLAVWIASLLVVPVSHPIVQVVRYQRARAKGAGAKEARAKARPLLPPLVSGRARGWADAIIYRDNRWWRYAQWAVTALALTAVVFLPFSPVAPGGWLRPAGSLVPVAVWWGMIGGRQRFLTRMQRGAAEGIRRIAAATLHYPRTKGALMSLATWLNLTTGWKAVRVTEWDTTRDGTPIIPRVFEVMAPGDLSVTDNKAWTEFEANLTAKYPRRSGWHVARKPNGSGAIVSPARYPVSAIWNGDVDNDNPMGFYIGESIDHPDSVQRLDLVNPSNHALVVGATGAGKTTAIEPIIAQNVLKTMPWDPTLHGSAHILDPKGPLASRWAGRPGVLCSRGNADGTNAEGDDISGFEVMASHCDLIEDEHRRRQEVLASYSDCSNWLELPDAVKAAHRLSPVLVVLDEFLDHTGKETAQGREAEQIKRDNAARAHILFMTSLWERKARNVGIHVIIISQEAKMTEIGSTRVRMAPVRIMAGRLDDVACKGFFSVAGSEMPYMPTTRRSTSPSGEVIERPIPGRCYVQMATGQPVKRFQAYWFGGSSNTGTLDRYLPRNRQPGAGIFDGDAARVRIAAMEDLDNNGVPDAWEQPQPDDALPSTPRPVGSDDDTSPDDWAPLPHAGEAPASLSGSPRCSYNGCRAEGDYTCPRNGALYCPDHTGPSPDPSEHGRFGQDYLDTHPLNRAGAAGIYREVGARARSAGLVASWAPIAGTDGNLTDQARITVTTPESKLVAIILAAPGSIQARTALNRQGVQGPESSFNAVWTAIDTQLAHNKTAN